MLQNQIFSLSELRESIRENGRIFEPVLLYLGMAIDGRKRQRICEEEGLHCPAINCLTPEQAAPLLWTRHKERAVKLFPAENLQEAAALYKTDLASVAHFFSSKPQKKSPSKRAHWKKYKAQQRVKHHAVPFPPPLWARLAEVAKKRGWSAASLIRVSVGFALQNMDVINEFARLEGGGAFILKRGGRCPKRRGRPRGSARKGPRQRSV